MMIARAYVVWACLIGQGLMIASWATGLGWEAWTQGPDAAIVLAGMVAASGVAGLVGETVWRRWRG